MTQRIGNATHHIEVNGSRIVLKNAPKLGEAPAHDESGSQEQCEDCGLVDSDFTYRGCGLFVCQCGAKYPIQIGGYEDVA